MDQAVQQMAKASAWTHEELMGGIKDLLAGHPSHVQGSVLAESLAIWLAGHPDYVRETFLAQHVGLVKALLPSVEQEMFNGGRHPGNLGRAE